MSVEDFLFASLPGPPLSFKPTKKCRDLILRIYGKRVQKFSFPAKLVRAVGFHKGITDLWLRSGGEAHLLPSLLGPEYTAIPINV